MLGVPAASEVLIKSKDMLDNKIFKDKEIVCIYHDADYDGWASAEIVRKYFSGYNNIKDLNTNVDVKFIGMNYGIKIDYKELENKVIICCDYTPENFRDIIKKSAYTIWIDHHKSSALDMKDFNPDNLEKVLSLEYSACMGVWKYFFANEKIPQTVELLSKFDTFTFTPAEKNDCLCFQYGLDSLGKSSKIEGASWDDIFESKQSFIDDILIKGQLILDYRTGHFDVQVANRAGRTTILEVLKLNKTYRVAYLNSPYCFSECFKPFYDASKHDILITGYQNKDGRWAYSFYCPADKDIDVSLIAKEFGGGGHKGASGCTSDKQIV